RYIEAEKGNFQWERSDQIVQAANKLGLKIIARLDNQPSWATAPGVFPATSPPDNLQDFANYVFTIVDRYKAGSPYGYIDAYEIWNEPNLAREWGNRRPDAGRYVEMLRLAYQAAKRADPKAVVISAGLSPTTASGDIATPDVEYLKQMYAAGARPYFDLLGIHVAGYKAPPELSPDDVAQDPMYNHNEGAAGRIYSFRHAEDLRQVMVANGDEQKQVAILEFGWTADDRPNSPYAWHAVSRQEQADYLVRAFQYAREHWQPWISVMVALYVADPGWDPTMEQYYWSVTQPNGRPWPAYDALKQMPK
ncbi:MAG: endo-1,4-beta-xylanase, partial [Chloroflexi bacterium]|nr:endo-1,4-beta-xylanase [Chloroflexota bacterium]